MTMIRCDMENCYWRMDGNCSREVIKIKDYHCENYCHHQRAKVIEHPGVEDEHYWYCSICGNRNVYIDDNFCLHCGVRFAKND